MTTNSAEIVHRLEKVGLSEKEAEVYLALSSLGGSTAYKIAEHCEVKKPTVYVILEELRKKGLVLKVPHVKKGIFTARSIEEYLAEQETQLMSARAIVPQIDALRSNSNPNVFFFTGLRGIEQAINYKIETMSGKEFCGFYSNLADASDELLKLYRDWDRAAVKSSISFNIVMSAKNKGSYYKEIIDLSKQYETVRIKFLKDFPYPENQTIDIGKDFVRMIDESKLQATIIDDRHTAEAFRQIFKIAWDKGELE